MSQTRIGHFTTVFVKHRFSARAECSCTGWIGPRRMLRGRAVADAMFHTAKTDHQPGWPLIINQRPPDRSRLGVGLLMVASAIIGIALAFSIPAQAGPVTDAAFLSALDDADIGYTTPDAAITAAHTVCTAFDQGHTLNQVGAAVHDASGLSWYQAGWFIGAATYTYCPEHLDQLDAGSAA